MMWRFTVALSRRCLLPAWKSVRLLETEASTPVLESSLTRPPLPLITSRDLQYKPRYGEPRQAWLCNLDTVEEEKLGLIDLHPSVFAVMPRMDIIWHNYNWQENYRFVDFKVDYTRAEMPGGGRKPWPQKGTGRARHGSIRSPIFLKGGKAHGKRGPETKFFMLPLPTRVFGLINTLTCKYTQNDLVIVDSLEIPSDDPKFIEDLIERRKWGVSVLFVNDIDLMPRNITLATDKMESVTLMPYYGLNVYSMLKYETLVLTLEALNKIEERLLFNLHRADLTPHKFHVAKINQSVRINSD